MKILVLSDTHGHIEGLSGILKAHPDIEMILHLGDCYRDRVMIQALYNKKIEQVLGNNDRHSPGLFNKIIEIEGHRIFMTHGHIEEVQFGLSNLYYKGLENRCELILFGHTHVTLDIEEKGVRIINPGSFTRPRNGLRPSYLLLDIEKTFIKSEIIYF